MKAQLLAAYYSLAARLRQRIELWRKMRAERKNRELIADWCNPFEDKD